VGFKSKPIIERLMNVWMKAAAERFEATESFQIIISNARQSDQAIASRADEPSDRGHADSFDRFTIGDSHRNSKRILNAPQGNRILDLGSRILDWEVV
jgi:hypothetical protein